MKRILAYRNGERLSYNDFGSPNGYPVLLQHGMVASIADESLFGRLVLAGRRLIAIARPGYGDSSPQPLPNMAEWGQVVSRLAEELGLTRFDVLGMSSGAPYSYAIAHHMPEKTRAVYIFSGIPALYDPGVVAAWPHPLDPGAGISELKALAKQLFFSGLSVDELQSEDVHDSMRNGCYGIAQDLKLRCSNWGFSLAEVRTPVYMQHSRADIPEAAQRTANLLPDCHLEWRDGAHFSPELLDGFIHKTMLKHDGNHPV